MLPSNYDSYDVLEHSQQDKRNNNDTSLRSHYSKSDRSKSSRLVHRPIMLQPFGHQVSGRASILCFNKTTLLKSFVQREVYFYRTMPHDLRPLTSEFRGIVDVTFAEDLATGLFVSYALPGTILRPHSRQVASLSEKPKAHSKRCVKDRGQTHVIYPSTTLHDYDSKLDNDDVMSELSSGFEASVAIDDRCEVKSGLENPWNAKMLQEAWSRIKEKPLNLLKGKTRQFVMLENVASKFVRPCVLDVKVGTRVRQNASAEKLARHQTAINIGARISGMQIFHPGQQEFVYHNKYFGHQLSVEGFYMSLRHFFSRGKIPLTGSEMWNSDDLDRELLKGTLVKLKNLRSAIGAIKSHRFYSSSVLLLYEGAVVADGHTSDESITDDKEITSKSDIWNGVALGEYIHKLRQHSQKSTKSKSWHGTDQVHKSPNTTIPMRKRHQSAPNMQRNRAIVDVRMIDFAHFCFHDDKIHPGPDPGFMFGLDNLIQILHNFLSEKVAREPVVASV